MKSSHIFLILLVVALILFGYMICSLREGFVGQSSELAQTNWVDSKGVSFADALAAPRFVWTKALGQNAPTLKIEPDFDADLAAALAKVGHDVETVDNKDGFGHAGMLVKNPKDGSVEAGHDPRADGDAKGL